MTYLSKLIFHGIRIVHELIESLALFVLRQRDVRISQQQRSKLVHQVFVRNSTLQWSTVLLNKMQENEKGPPNENEKGSPNIS